MHGKGVQQFVANEVHRALRHPQRIPIPRNADPVVKLQGGRKLLGRRRICACLGSRAPLSAAFIPPLSIDDAAAELLQQRLTLLPPQRRACLDQVHASAANRVVKRGQHLGRTEGVAHQRALSGPHLHQPDCLGVALQLPQANAPDAHELAEDAGELRRRHEVSSSSKHRWLGGVVSVQRVQEAKVHVLGDREAAACHRNHLIQVLRQGVHVLWELKVHERRSRLQKTGGINSDL
mmetsp:Transcript_4640/g.18525  ORF Transcript_4640/g.18525 Transcript_4640/m.18525 type:complete len:235 (-) Transcript_4640:136-840(-)